MLAEVVRLVKVYPDGRRKAIAATSADWYACEHPERPFDLDAIFCERQCRGCSVALDMAIRTTTNEKLRAGMRHVRTLMDAER